MKPVLFAFHAPILGEVTFPAYFTLLAIGFGLAMVLTVRESRKLGQDPQRILDTNLWMVVWGVIGARVLHLVADGHFHDYVNLCRAPELVPAIDAKVSWCATAAQCGYDYLCNAATHTCHPPKDCFAALEIWRGGLAYYGGFLAAVPFAWWYVRKHQLGWWKTADLASPGIMLGLFFGRIGCFLNGCCYGKVTQSAIGVVFPRGSAPWRAQLDDHVIAAGDAARAVHPTQLYESVACLAIFALLYYVVRPRRRAFGQVFASMLIFYALARSICEVFRDDDRGVFFGGWVSTSQLISLPLAAGGIALLWWLARQRRAVAAGA
ncbi:MAG TPA: prolipoprotein diacylglyceryl transferase [Polyangia bacterium]|nr:prolipoprotein diacylglyceryl transferase [Polyangia bacterium]